MRHSSSGSVGAGSSSRPPSGSKGHHRSGGSGASGGSGGSGGTRHVVPPTPNHSHGAPSPRGGREQVAVIAVPPTMTSIVNMWTVRATPARARAPPLRDPAPKDLTPHPSPLASRPSPLAPCPLPSPPAHRPPPSPLPPPPPPAPASSGARPARGQRAREGCQQESLGRHQGELHHDQAHLRGWLFVRLSAPSPPLVRPLSTLAPSPCLAPRPSPLAPRPSPIAPRPSPLRLGME